MLAFLTKGSSGMSVNPSRSTAGEKTILWVIAIVTLARLMAIGFSPLGLDVEEAQYWQWSTTPDAGYFTKPPMIAWLIGVSTSLFGLSEFGVRAFAPLLQALAALLILAIGKQAQSQRVGIIAAAIWISLPASALGGFIISTDSPMVVFLLAAILMLTPLSRGEALTPSATMIAGVMFGLAMMSKYAAAYLLVGLVIWWLWQGRHRQRLNLTGILIFLASAIIALSPNLVWNLHHGFVTVGHLSDNANLDETVLSFVRPFEFLFSQMGVAGPVIAGLAVAAMWRLRHDPSARFWIALGLPALVVVTAQAVRNDANANWAIASWPSLVMLLSMWIAGASPRLLRLAKAGVLINAALSLIILISTVMGSFGPFTPPSDPLRRLRAWESHHQDLARFTAAHQAEIILTFRREHIAKMIWHHRFQPLPIYIVDQNGVAENHFEQRLAWHPQDAAENQSVIAITGEETPPEIDGIAWQGITAISMHRISAKKHRRLVFHLGRITDPR